MKENWFDKPHRSHQKVGEEKLPKKDSHFDQFLADSVEIC